MYGIINRFVAHPGQRDALIGHMVGEEEAMEGCRSFVVARDPADPDAVWVTEAWDSKAHWQASLQLPRVKASIERAIPLVRDWGETRETEPVAVLPKAGV